MKSWRHVENSIHNLGKRVLATGISVALLGMILALSACQSEPAKIAFLGKVDKTNDWSYFTMKEDGSNQIKLADNHNWFVAPDPRQSWSRDNAKLAYIEYAKDESSAWLCVVDSDGSNRRQLMNITGLDEVNISMASDGNTVLLTYQERGSVDVPHEGHIDIETIPITQVRAVDVTTGTAKQVADIPNIKGQRAVFSPDGQKIAFIGRTDDPYTHFGIYVMNADGSNLRKLTEDNGLMFARPLYWSPDSSRILYTPYNVFINDYTQYADIYLMDATSGNYANLTNSPNANDFDPSWSPDGKRIAFCSGNSTEGYRTYVMDADGGNTSRLYDSSSAPCWLPDGKRILFADRLNINVVDADGKNLKTLANVGDTYLSISYPIWLYQ